MTAEEQAVVLVNEVRAEREQELWKSVGDRRGYGIVLEALCRALEQHEAFKQKVSDAVVSEYLYAEYAPERMQAFITPKPKPDPLVDVLANTYGASLVNADELRAALEARGLEIREKGK